MDTTKSSFCLSRGVQTLFVLLGFALWSSTVFGQTIDENIGFRNPSLFVSINGNQIDGDNVGGYNHPGLALGGSIQFGISESSSIQIEILYNMKGSRVTNDQIIEEGKPYFQFRNNYASLPLLFHHYWIENTAVFLGPSLNFLVNARKEVRADGWIEASETFRSFDLCGELGFQYDILDNLFVSGRIMYSILPMNNYAITAETNTATAAAYNHTLSIRLGYIIEDR